MESQQDIVVNCSAIDNSQFVGPHQVFASIHGWSIAVYVILAIHAFPMWFISAKVIIGLKTTCDPLLSKSLMQICLLPPVLMLMSAIGILFPSTGPVIHLGGDLIICWAMVNFVLFTTKLSGGRQALVQKCFDTKTGLPIGAPPFVCLALIKQPITVTEKKLYIVSLLPVILIFLKLALLLMNIIESATDARGEESMSERARYVSIPLGLTGVYSYSVYLIIIAKVLDRRVKTIGFILLGLFVLSNAIEVFFLFLKGTGMLSCVPPAMTLISVEHLLKNCIKGFLGFAAGMPYLKICSEKYLISYENFSTKF